MIDHLTLVVSDLGKSKKFFKQALLPLGYKLQADHPDHAGFGISDVKGQRDFWIREGNITNHKSLTCLAFRAKNKEEVNSFYEAAMNAGGKSHLAPNYMPQYHKGYYASFVYDPDGYNIEAVFDDLYKL